MNKKFFSIMLAAIIILTTSSMGSITMLDKNEEQIDDLIGPKLFVDINVEIDMEKAFIWAEVNPFSIIKSTDVTHIKGLRGEYYNMDQTDKWAFTAWMYIPGDFEDGGNLQTTARVIVYEYYADPDHNLTKSC